MGAAIRHVFGPFGETISQSGTAIGPGWGGNVRWYFHGVRSDGTMAAWVLTYEIKTRTWRANGLPMDDKPPKPDLIDAMLPANLADMPVFTGKVVDILRTRLPPEAFATAVRLTAAAPW